MGFPQHRFGVELSLDQKKDFIRNGYLVVQDAIPKELINRALRAINHNLATPSDPNAFKTVASACPELMVSKVLLDLLNASPAREYVEQLVGQTQPVRATQIALRYPGSGCLKEGAKKLGNSAHNQNLGSFLQNPLVGGIVNQFLGTDDEDSNYIYTEHWPRFWHIDGFPDAIKQIQTGVVKNFTMLLGIYLSGTPEDYMGNFTVYPGSHHVLEKAFQEHGGAIPFLNRENPFEGIIHVRQAVEGKLAPPVQLHIQPGDIVLAHYQTAHTIAPNISPHVRYALYFRLHHHSHQYDHGKPDCLTNIWVDFDGIRDLAKEMKENGEI